MNNHNVIGILLCSVFTLCEAATFTIGDDTVDVSDELIAKSLGVADTGQDNHIVETNFFGVSIGGKYKDVVDIKLINLYEYSFKPSPSVDRMGFNDFKFSVAPLSGVISTVTTRRSYSEKLPAELHFLDVVQKLSKHYNRKIELIKLDKDDGKCVEFKFLTIKLSIAVLCLEGKYWVTIIACREMLEQQRENELNILPQSLYGIRLGGKANFSILKKRKTDNPDKKVIYTFTPVSGKSIEGEDYWCVVSEKTKRICQIEAILSCRGVTKEKAIELFAKRQMYLYKLFGKEMQRDSNDTPDGDIHYNVDLNDHGTYGYSYLFQYETVTNDYIITSGLQNYNLMRLEEVETGKISMNLDKSSIIFGVYLGRTQDEQIVQKLSTCSENTNKVLAVSFIPPRRLDGFSQYIYRLTPQTKYVFEVSAMGIVDNKLAAEKRIKAIKKAFKKILKISLLRNEKEGTVEQAFFRDESGLLKKIRVKHSEYLGGKRLIEVTVTDMAYAELDLAEEYDEFELRAMGHETHKKRSDLGSH